MGTDIAGFYYDMEMLAHNEKVCTEIPQVGNGPGKWYRGKVIGERWTEKNKLMYECRFNTPLHIHWYTETYAGKEVTSFNANKVAQSWRCETETIPPVCKELVVGDFITRWFPTHELLKDFVNPEGVRGACVDAIVLEVVTKKGKNPYKSAFDAPLSREISYGEAETDMYRKRYLDRRAPFLQDEVVKRTLQNTLCKGALQRASVAESCAVVSRVQNQPKLVIKETQEDAQDDEGKQKIDTVFMARAFKELINQATVEDVSESSDIEEGLLFGTSQSPTQEEAVVTTPKALYTSEQKHLRMRLFPHKVCGDPASGAHQCGYCFSHVNVICAPPYPGSPEGHGQLVLCGKTGITLATVAAVGGSKTRTKNKLSLTENRRRKHTKTDVALPTTTLPLTPPPPPPAIARIEDASAGEMNKSLNTQIGKILREKRIQNQTLPKHYSRHDLHDKIGNTSQAITRTDDASAGEINKITKGSRHI